MSVVLQAAALALGPLALFAVAWFLLIAPARYRRVACAPFTAAWFVLRRRIRALVGRSDPEPAPAVPDPFDALGVQLALARLTVELESLADNQGIFARSFRVAATQAAYDDVLAHACTLAQVPLQRTRDTDRAVTRLLEEAQLAQRGWMW